MDHIALGRKPAVDDFVGGHFIGQLVHDLGVDKADLQIWHMGADGVQDLAHSGVSAEHVIDLTIEQPGFDRMNNNTDGDLASPLFSTFVITSTQRQNAPAQ